MKSLGKLGFHDIEHEELQKRAIHAEAFLISKFRVSFKLFLGANISTLENKIDIMLTEKKKEAEEVKINEAVAKAKKRLI